MLNAFSCLAACRLENEIGSCGFESVLGCIATISASESN